MSAVSAKRAPAHRVLIIDDEEATRLLLARIVSHDMKAEVSLAGTCEQALRMAGDYAFDAILLDLLMPGIGGLAVLRELRAHSPNLATPVIVVSVLDDSETIRRCTRAGANAYLVKPVERKLLVKTVKAQIAARRHRRKRRKE